MSSIPYNYGKYVDDTQKLRDQGHVDAGKQVQSPASAGSRGLNKTVQFTKDPTQMKMGESINMEDMKTLISRIDRIQSGAEAVQEDAGEQALANELSKYYQDSADGYDPEDKGNDEHEEAGQGEGEHTLRSSSESREDEEVEPRLGGEPDVVTRGLHETRIERLRMLGNGVVWLTAAKAFSELLVLHQEDVREYDKLGKI